MDRLACKRQVWTALAAGEEQDLHQAVWDVTLNELHSGSCSYRQALLDALDVTAVTDAASTIKLLQRYIQLAQSGSSQAQCFAGVLLCFHSPLDGHGGAHQHSQGFRYLLSSHYQHNNLATLFLALCYEAARGTGRSVESALECYQTAFTRGYQIAHILFLESSRDHGAGAGGTSAAVTQASSGYQPELEGPAAQQSLGVQQLAPPPPPPPLPPSTSQHSSSPSLDLQALQDISLNGHERRLGSSSNTTVDSLQLKEVAQSEAWDLSRHNQQSYRLHATEAQVPAAEAPDSPTSESSASVLQSSEDLLSRSLEDMLDGLEQLPAHKAELKQGTSGDEQRALALAADDEAGLTPAAPLGPMSWSSGLGSSLTNGHSSNKEGPRADSNPWGDLQPGGQVDWSIRPKAASLVAANKAGSRSASPAPSAVSIRSLPNLAPPQSKLPTKSASQEGLGSPRGDPLAGMSSAEIQAHMAQQAEGAASAEAGSLSDNTFGGSGSRGSPVGSLADSATGLPGAGDKGAGQAALEPSIQEADKLQGALSRWCSSAHSSEDEAVILASDYIPADIKEAVCSSSPQVRQNMQSMLHALLFPSASQSGTLAQSAQPAKPCSQPPVSLPKDAPQQLNAGLSAVKQPALPPRRKGQASMQPALPMQSSIKQRAPSPGLPGVGMPLASMGDLYGLPQRANPLIAPGQYNASAAAGRQLPLGAGLGPAAQAGRFTNQASDAQQAMLMQVLAQQNARAPDLLNGRQLPARPGQLPRHIRPASQLPHMPGPLPNGRPRGLNPLQPLPTPLAGQAWGPGGQLLSRPFPPAPRPHERSYSPLLTGAKPGVERPALGFNNQAGLRGAQLLGSSGPLQTAGGPEALASQAAWLGGSLPNGPQGAGLPGLSGLTAAAEWQDQGGDPLSLHLSASQQRMLQARAGLGPQQPAPPSRVSPGMGVDALSNLYLANAASDRPGPMQGDPWRTNNGSRPYNFSAGQLQGSQLPPDLASQLLGAGLPPGALNSNTLSQLAANHRLTPDLNGLAHSGGWTPGHAQDLYSASLSPGQLKAGLAVSGPASDTSYAGLQGYANPLQYSNSYRPT